MIKENGKKERRFARLMRWLMDEMLCHYSESRDHIFGSIGYQYLQEVEKND